MDYFIFLILLKQTTSQGNKMNSLPNELKLKVIKEIDAEGIYNILGLAPLHPFLAIVIKPEMTLRNTLGHYSHIWKASGLNEDLIQNLTQLHVTKTGLLLVPFIKLLTIPDHDYLHIDRVHAFIFVDEDYPSGKILPSLVTTFKRCSSSPGVPMINLLAQRNYRHIGKGVRRIEGISFDKLNSFGFYFYFPDLADLIIRQKSSLFTKPKDLLAYDDLLPPSTTEIQVLNSLDIVDNVDIKTVIYERSFNFRNLNHLSYIHCRNIVFSPSVPFESLKTLTLGSSVTLRGLRFPQLEKLRILGLQPPDSKLIVEDFEAPKLAELELSWVQVVSFKGFKCRNLNKITADTIEISEQCDELAFLKQTKHLVCSVSDLKYISFFIPFERLESLVIGVPETYDHVNSFLNELTDAFHHTVFERLSRLELELKFIDRNQRNSEEKPVIELPILNTPALETISVEVSYPAHLSFKNLERMGANPRRIELKNHRTSPCFLEFDSTFFTPTVASVTGPFTLSPKMRQSAWFGDKLTHLEVCNLNFDTLGPECYPYVGSTNLETLILRSAIIPGSGSGSFTISIQEEFPNLKRLEVFDVDAIDLGSFKNLETIIVSDPFMVSAGKLPKLKSFIYSNERFDPPVTNFEEVGPSFQSVSRRINPSIDFNESDLAIFQTSLKL